MTPSNPKRKLPLWRFLVPLAVQVAIVLSIPAQKVMTITNGTTVYLKTAPIDPYDVLRGRYVTLNYDISQRSRLESLPGWSDELAIREAELYVVLEPPTNEQSREPWQPVA
ncbi:MAG: GDYXXLXY domain-containing protein, partial [Moorea sp. SIO3C2]|nr:GDYXXLXY domain-containing protein [Moorena sp. SIO3C2]